MTSYKNIFQITYPIFLTLIAQNIINVTDTAFLGRVSEVALGASAIAGVYFFAIYVVGFGFSQGAQILIGRRNGEGNYAQIGPIFNNGMFFISLLSLFFFVVSYFGNSTLMKHLVSSPQVYEASIEYLDWRIYGFFFAFINVMFRAFFVGITKTSILTISAVITAITNIIFDYALIFGNWGFPELGIAGAAIASVIAEIVTMIYLLIHTIHKSDISKYQLFTFKRIEFKSVVQILDLSIFIMFQYFISISTWFMFFIFIERMGERPLAVTNIGRSLYILLMIPGSAIATTVNTLVSNLIGSGEQDKIIPFINRTVGIALLMVVPLMIFTFFFPTLFARIYTDDPELMLACIPVMKVVSVAMIFCAIGNIVFNGVSGTGNTRTAFAIEFLTLFFYLGYVYYTTIVLPSAVEIVWMSEFVYWILIGVFGYWYLLKGNWRKRII
jgi:putative MATE family efflux protein